MTTTGKGTTIHERWATDEPPALPLCARCRHKTLGAATCVAFPGGIPEMFRDGTEQHNRRYWDEPVIFEAPDRGEI
jgi:hypothetical protein